LRGPFTAMDAFKRAQGEVLGALGWGPNECAFRVVDSGQGWRLREYLDCERAASMLIVAAPIKRPYIWDLSPSTSTIRHCLRRRLHLYLLEWVPAGADCTQGIDEYVRAIARCVATISGAGSGATANPFVMGHSLGGTLAAIFGTVAPDSIRGLVLLGAPLCFEPGTSPFRDALAAMVPTRLADEGPFPGSLVSQLSVLAAPATFIWSRLTDAVFSSADRHALDVHARVERWALDEAPLPGKLGCELVEWLYREDRLCRGTLEVANRIVGPSMLSVHTLAVVNKIDEIAPLASVKTFIGAMPAGKARLIEYSGEVGVCLQHLGILIGRRAHEEVWPAIFSWVASVLGPDGTR